MTGMAAKGGLLMKAPARLIIPVWGEAYVSKLLSLTLPAVLAPGNLPALNELFDVELLIVTETRLFDLIQASRAFRSAQKLGAARLISLDDLMLDDPIDYGAVLTHALFRGFSDLGAAMTETYLLFLNADFIVGDGSLAHLGRLMREGKRVIHAPSFRVTREDVMPQLQARVDSSTGTLRIPSREMVKLALANKHRTVKARTVNQRLSHQAWMDQYYWYVDEGTLIGYQWPIALVAIKPERVVTAPLLVWDYGFIPEAAPTAERYFIDDSDDFFMLEPQSGDSGDAMIRLGWISFDDIARNLSMWTTKEQRECGSQLLKIHASDLPEGIDRVIEESRAYMAEIRRRLSPDPVSHIGHTYLSPWFDGAVARMRRGDTESEQRRDSATAAIREAPNGLQSNSPSGRGPLINFLKTIYRGCFGIPPQVNKFHPLWADSSPITGRIAAWRHAGAQNILWVSSRDSLLYRLLGERVDLSALLTGRFNASAMYDACVCELQLDELSALDRLYRRIRPLIADDGPIAFYVGKGLNVLDGAELLLERTDFPSIDISAIHFFGTVPTWLLSKAYLRMSVYLQRRPVMRGLASATILLACAPVAWCANARAARRNSEIFRSTWTSLVIDFIVKRARHPERQVVAEAQQAQQVAAEAQQAQQVAAEAQQAQP
jgi:hypothetical protein